MALVAEQIWKIGAESGVGVLESPLGAWLLVASGTMGAWDLGGINSYQFLGELGSAGKAFLFLQGIVFVVIACLRNLEKLQRCIQ
jgi:hypothetical protein